MSLKDADAAFISLNPQPFPLPLGPWAEIVEAAFLGMNKRDWVLPGPRARIGATLRGCPAERLIHPQAGAKPYKIGPSSMDPAARALHAVGLAMGSNQPTLVILGMAAEANGALTEAYNLCSLTGAVVVFVLIRQELKDDAPIGRQSAADPRKLAAAYGLNTSTVSGSAVKKAVAKARESGKSTLIIANL